MISGKRFLINVLLYMISAVGLIFAAGPAAAINTDDAFPLHQENPHPSLNKHPLLHIPVEEYRTHNPNLTDEINEPHPYPDYLKKFPRRGRFPVYYHQLLEVHPDDQVQSKVFDSKAFKQARRIGVVFFENKTQGLGQDKNAGHLVANQFSDELQSVKQLSIISPTRMLEEFQLKMITTPEQKPSAGKGTKDLQPVQPQSGYDLPYSREKFDAVLIGTVTRYTNRYRNHLGRPDTSEGAGVEFGVYLISTRTGEAIWGAQFTGSQTVSMGNIFSAKNRWMDKQNFSRHAIKKVLKDFRDMANSE